MELDKKWQYIIVEAALIFTLIMAPNGHRNYSSEEDIEEVLELKAELSEKMHIVKGDSPNYDNTVLWVFADRSTGAYLETPYRTMFAIPSGFATNLVYDSWIVNTDSIKSRYMMTTPGGDTERKFIELGAVKIAEAKNFVMYQNY